MKKVDVAIVGLGGMGSFAFRTMSQQFKHVVGFEQFDLAHTKGAHHGETRIFRTAYGEGLAYVKLLQQARKQWLQFEQERDTSFYEQVGGISFGYPTDPFIQNALESVAAFHLPHELLDTDELRARYPMMAIEDGMVGIVDHHAGYLYPEKAVEHAVQSGIDAGGQAYTKCPVHSITPVEEGILLQTANGEWLASQVIVAAGGWLKQYLPEEQVPITIERQLLAWFETTDERLHAPQYPIFSTVTDGIGFYGFPSLDGQTIKMAIHHDGEYTTHPDLVRRTISSNDFDRLRQEKKKHFPTVSDTIAKESTCFYTNTPDEHFIVGPSTSDQRIFLAGPMAGHGFKFAPAIADLIAQQMKEIPTEWDAFFAPNRFTKQS